MGKSTCGKRSFKTIVDKLPRFNLVRCGESLRQQQYYAYTRNLFWHLIPNFDAAIETEYIKNQQFVLGQNIALWDVYESCEREGSLDSNIRAEKLNDIAGLLEANPGIEYVFCNGNTAWKQFCQYT